MIRFAQIMILFGVISIFSLLFGFTHGVAAPPFQEATPIPNLSISDEYCLSCHGQPGQTYPLDDGTTLDLYVDPAEHANSIHGSQGYACVQCHTDVGEYPHPAFSAANQREVTIQLNGVCQRCHASEHTKTMDSIHAKAQAEGKQEAAVCTDCHTAHSVQDWVDDQTGETLPTVRPLIPQTCAKCHSAIYEKYKTTVHGAALTEENNPDVPTCIDCHGVHNIEDATTAAFRVASPEMCAKCHTDPARMAKYGISTDVLDTYVADFHGTTVKIFEQQSPDAETNKPVCYDCHGIHDIKRADDPEKGLHVQENLLTTCQKCHPDARENFPTAWLSHYIPSPERYPLVYYVNLFYLVFIPVLLGGMAILVVMDISRRIINRSRKRRLASEMEKLAGSSEIGQEADIAEEESQIIETSVTDNSPGEPATPSQSSQEDGEEVAHG